MTIFDYAVLVVLGLSVIVSLMRGAVREIISFLGWLLAFYIARTYSIELIPYLPEGIPSESLSALVAFVVMFLVVLLAVSFVAIGISNLIKLLGFGWLDRILGGLIGLLRGLLIVCGFVMLAGMTDLPKDSRWVNAMFSSPLEALVVAALPWMPESIAKHVHLGEPLLREKMI